MHRSYFFALILLVAATGLIAQQNAPAQPSQAANKLLSDDLNHELPKWLNLSAEYRARVEGFTGGGFKPDTDDAYMLSRVRINLSVAPASWLKFGFQGRIHTCSGKIRIQLCPHIRTQWI